MRCKGILAVLLLVGLGFLMSVPARATLTGTLNLMGEVRLDATHFDWLPVGGGAGFIINGFSSTGSFTAIPGFAFGIAKDLDLALTPVGAPLALSSYMLLPNPGPIFSFDLNFIFPGATSGPLTLTDTTTGLNLAWGVRTTATDLRDSSTACFIGTYSSQIIGMTGAEVLALLGSGGSITSTYSASFSPCPVPLPATAPLVLAGLAGLFWQLARRRHQHLCRVPVSLSPKLGK